MTLNAKIKCLNNKCFVCKLEFLNDTKLAEYKIYKLRINQIKNFRATGTTYFY